MFKSFRKFLSIFLISLAVSVIVLSLLGYLSFAIVVSGSMEPTVPRGSLAVVFKSGDYGVGDVVLFKAYNRLILHRIVGLEDGCFLTKGDANVNRDAWGVVDENIVGELYLVVPYLGFVVNGLRRPLVFAVLITLLYLFFELRGGNSSKSV